MSECAGCVNYVKCANGKPVACPLVHPPAPSHYDQFVANYTQQGATCPCCRQPMPRTGNKYVLIGKPGADGKWSLRSATHFEIHRHDAERRKIEIWCTHGAWRGVLDFTPAGQIEVLTVEVINQEPQVHKFDPDTDMLLTNEPASFYDNPFDPRGPTP